MKMSQLHRRGGTHFGGHRSQGEASTNRADRHCLGSAGQRLGSVTTEKDAARWRRQPWKGAAKREDV